MHIVFECARFFGNLIVDSIRPERLLNVERFENDSLHRTFAARLDLQLFSVEKLRREFDQVG